MYHKFKFNKQFWATTIALLLLILIVACSPTSVPEGDSSTKDGILTITGQVISADNTEKITLPSDNQIIVLALDTSLADAPAIVLGEQILTKATSLPVAYEVRVSLDDIKKADVTTISVRIENDAGHLLFINDTMNPISPDNPVMDITVIPVTPSESSSALPSAFEGQVWQWLAFEDSADGEESNDITVEEPNKYTLELLADGSYAILADCNSGSGKYTLDGSSLMLEPGPITLAYCGTESLSDQFVALLGDVATFVFDAEGHLILNLKMDAGNMIFSPLTGITR